MPWIRLLEEFNWCVRGNVFLNYKKDHKYFVKQACADEAVKSGKAIEINRDGTSKDASR